MLLYLILSLPEVDLDSLLPPAGDCGSRPPSLEEGEEEEEEEESSD